MANKRDTKPDSSQSMIYQIRLQGHLGPQWSAWFADMTITLEDTGETLLTGPVIDQAVVYGLLKKVRDLGLPLLSVIRVETGQGDATSVNQYSPIQSRTGEPT